MTGPEAGGKGEVNPLSLVEQAKADSLAFFGVEKSVPPPPVALFSVLSRLRELGLREVEGIYMPQATLSEGDPYPGWRRPIGEQYYQWYKAGQVSKAAPELPGRWIAVETFRRPDYSVIKELKTRHGQPKETYRPELDQIGIIIDEGRFDGKIAIKGRSGDLIVPYLPQDSRFAVSSNQQDDYVFPELTKVIGVEGISLRRPTLAELNYLGNLARFSHLNEATTLETVQDVFRGIAKPEELRKPEDANDPNREKFPRAIITGSRLRDGVSGVDYMLATDQVDAVTFRMVIEFV